MTELQQSRYDQLLRRLGDLKGPGSKVSDVISELFPMIDVERVPGELLFLSGTHIAWGGGLVLAVAAQNAIMQLENPPGSGQLMTVSTASFATGAGQEIRMAVAPIIAGGNSSNQVLRDTRRGVAEIPVGLVTLINQPASITSQTQFRILANTETIITDPNGIVVLVPDTAFQIATTVVNTSLTASIFWRERVAEPSELNF